MTDPGADRCLPALAAALRALLGPEAGACERALAAFAEPVGLDFAAFLEPTATGFGPRGLWLRERGAPRADELKLPARWLEALDAGRCVTVSAGEPVALELKPLRLFGAAAVLLVPARAGERSGALCGVLLLAAQAPRFTWSEAHEQAASALAAGLAAALIREGEAAAVLDQLPQRIAWKDAQLRYRGCNRAFARAAGLSGAQLLGREDRELVLRPELGDRGPAARRREREVMTTGRPQLARVESTPLAAGREQWHVVSRLPLPGPDGRPAGLTVVSEDVTDRMQAAAMLRHAERTAAVSRLAAAITADLHAALSEIEAAGDARTQQAARGATDLLRQLSAFARRQLADPVDVAPAALVARMGALLGRVFAGVALELPGEGLRCAVRTDPRQLELLVVALARHVRAHLSPGTRVALDVAPLTLGLDRSLAYGLPAGEYVRLRFSTGPLGPGEADMSSASSGRLALAQAIARHAGGALRIAGEGEGLVAEALLPRVFSLPAAPSAEPAPDLRGVEAVLVLDDDVHLRGAVAAVLRQLGYEVVLAEDLDEALAVQRSARPPLVLALVSAELPGGPLEAVRGLQKSQPELRALLLARHTGNGDALVVPCSFEALAARVRQALDSRGA
jgi:PAS domain S-box-containing protein